MASPILPPESDKQIHAPVDDDDPAVVGLGPACAAAYSKLEACLADNDRDWTACQEQVKALRECTSRGESKSKNPGEKGEIKK